MVKELGVLLTKLHITTLLDDFNWMRKVNLSGIKHTGAGIVEPIIENNIKNYHKQGTFQVLDLTNQESPKNDLIF